MRKVTPRNLAQYLSGRPEDCLHVLKQCHSVGKSLNSPTKRWLKAELIDRAYSLAFNDLIYQDEVGYDWSYKGLRVSGKSQAKMFGQRMEATYNVKISNTIGKSQKRGQMFDNIILTQSAAPFSIAVAKYSDVKDYFTYVEDGIVMKAPYYALDFVIHPDEGIDFDDDSVFDYGKQFNKVIDDMLLQILTK
jgi:hypothetical protein